MSVLHHAVVCAGHLGVQHLIVLLAEMIQPMLSHGQQKGFLEFFLVNFSVVDGNLGTGPGI